MIPRTYPSTLASDGITRQMVVYFLSSISGLTRWVDYIPVAWASGSVVNNSYNTSGATAVEVISSTTGRQSWVDYVPVYLDASASGAWEVSLTGYIPINGGVASLFAAGEQGAWYDPSDFNSYMATGTELFPAVNFTDATTWTASGVGTTGLTANTFTTNTTAGVVSQKLTVGQWYQVTLTASTSAGTVSVNTADAFTPTIRTEIGTGSGTYSFRADYPYLYLRTSVGATVTVTALSLKPLTSISTATMYQDSAGTTPVTAVGQPVGLMLDKRLGAVRGSELSTASLSTWTVGAALTRTMNGDTAQIARSGVIDSANAFYKDFAVTSGSWYEVAYTIGNASGARNFTGTDVTGPLTDGTGPFRRIVRATAATIRLQFWPTSDLTTIHLSGVSLKEIPGNHRTQSTAASRPTLQQDASGYYYLSYDGVDDWMQTASVDFSATDKMTVWAGVHKASDAARGVFAELGNAPGTATFQLNAPSTTATADFNWTVAGSIAVSATSPTSHAAPVSRVVVGTADISGDSSVLRINGTQAASSSSDQGTGNYRNAVLYFGRRGGTTLPFNGREYQTIIRGATTSAAQLSAIEQFVASKTGVSF
jgi:hypothetical protein